MKSYSARSFNFLGLPREIRDKIYSLSLKFETTSGGFVSTPQVCTPELGLLRVNRQIYREAQQVFATENCFVEINTDCEDLMLSIFPCMVAFLNIGNGTWSSIRGRAAATQLSIQMFRKNFVMTVAISSRPHVGRRQSDTPLLSFVLLASDLYLLLTVLRIGRFPHQPVQERVVIGLYLHEPFGPDLKQKTLDSLLLPFRSSLYDFPLSVIHGTDEKTRNDLCLTVRRPRWNKIQDVYSHYQRKKDEGMAAYLRERYGEAGEIWGWAVHDLSSYLKSEELVNMIRGQFWSEDINLVDLCFSISLNAAMSFITVARSMHDPLERIRGAHRALGSLESYDRDGVAAWNPPVILQAKFHYRLAVSHRLLTHYLVPRRYEHLKKAFEAIEYALRLRPSDPIMIQEANLIQQATVAAHYTGPLSP